MTGQKLAAVLGGLAVWTVLLTSCGNETPSGAPPSVMKSAIDHPHDHRIFFNDGENRYVITLFDDGSYLFKTGDSSGLVTDTRNGQWSWKRSGTHGALLKLDADEWKLTFVSPDNAMAVNQSATARTQIFDFEPL